MRGIPFQFEVPLDFFEKADEEPGKRRRIGGVISTESQDRQGETVLADGLEFSDWIKNGWYNDNHTKDTDGIVGYPEYVKSFKRGETLPNGKKADTHGHWAEGYMLSTDRANRLWELGKALQGTGRRLGFSVEGKILRRVGPKTIAKKAEDGSVEYVGNRIAKALVRNVAITNCPVNTDTGLEILARSITAVELADPDDLESRLMVLEKAMGMGQADTSTAVANRGPQTGMGAGAVTTPKDLESDENPPKPIEDEESEKALSVNPPSKVTTPPAKVTGPKTGLTHIKPPTITQPPRTMGRGTPGQPAVSGMRNRGTSPKGRRTMPANVAQKSLSDAEAVAVVQWALPHADAATAGRIVELTKALKRSGKL
jgi:hypothetical protein